MHQDNNNLNRSETLDHVSSSKSKVAWQTPMINQLTAQNTEGAAKTLNTPNESTTWQGS